VRRAKGKRLLVLGSTLLLARLAGAQDAMALDSLTVRAGPDPRYPLVAQLGAGTPLHIHGCLVDWTWCDVAAADQRGWVFAPQIATVDSGRRRSPAPAAVDRGDLGC